MWFSKSDKEAYERAPTDEGELLKKVKKIQLQSARLVTDVMAGEYQSAFRGQGMDFDRLRDYHAGDDPRDIDWNVTARYNSPYVKTYKEERELTILFLVDHSASSLFGSATESKLEMMTELTATLAFNAIKKNDKVGLLLFSDHVEAFLPPAKGKGHVLRLIRDLLLHKPKGQGSDLSQALEYLNQVQKNRAVIFLVSDFLNLSLCDHLKLTGHKHDLVALEIFDPLEEAPFDLGLIELKDLETGRRQLIDSGNRAWQERYRARRAADLQTRLDFFLKHRIDHLRLANGENYVAKLRHFFKRRTTR